jgi:hypothetical protein
MLREYKYNVGGSIELATTKRKKKQAYKIGKTNTSTYKIGKTNTSTCR